MKKKFLFICFILFWIGSYGQNDTIFVIKNGEIIAQIPTQNVDSFVFYHPSVSITSYTDPRDNHVYPIVTIGTQVWMGSNLAYLPVVMSPGNGSNTTPCYYVDGYYGTNVNEAIANTNYSTYGVLYNWSAAMTACPPGWHLPSDSDWTVLSTFIGGESIGGGKLKETGTSHWSSPNTSATNEFNFTALPCGQRDHFNPIFNSNNNYGLWWSSTEYTSSTSYTRQMFHNSALIERNYHYKGYGNAVRCIMN